MDTRTAVPQAETAEVAVVAMAAPSADPPVDRSAVDTVDLSEVPVDRSEVVTVVAHSVDPPVDLSVVATDRSLAVADRSAAALHSVDLTLPVDPSEVRYRKHKV